MNKRNIGLSNRHNIERNCHCFHVCQHLSGNAKYFSIYGIAAARMNSLLENAEFYGIRVLHSVIMPNHTHDIVWCDDIKDLMRFYTSVNTSAAMTIWHRCNDEVKAIRGRIFSSRPRYTPITTLRQYYSTVRYLFLNPIEEQNLDSGFEAEFSTFSMYRRNYFPKCCDKSFHEKWLGLAIEELLDALAKPYADYNRRIYPIIARRSSREDELLFKIDCGAPYTSRFTENPV